MRRNLIYQAIDNWLDDAQMNPPRLGLCGDLGAPMPDDWATTACEFMAMAEQAWSDALVLATDRRGEPASYVLKATALLTACFRRWGCVRRGWPGTDAEFWGDYVTSQISSAIDEEREYQDGLPPNRTDGSEKSVIEYAVMARRYLRRAEEAWCSEAGYYGALDELRKVAAIGVKCLEDHGVAQ